MKKNRRRERGIAEVALLAYVVVGLIVLFVPNPVSSALGVGVRPNKVVEKQYDKERVELLKDKEGNIIAVKTRSEGGVSNEDKQQKVSLWEQVRSLPGMILVLVIFGILFPPAGVVLLAAWKRARTGIKKVLGEKEALMTDTKKIVKGIDSAFATVPLTLAGINLPGEVDRAALAEKIIEEMKWELRDFYNDSTKELVKKIKLT